MQEVMFEWRRKVSVVKVEMGTLGISGDCEEVKCAQRSKGAQR